MARHRVSAFLIVVLAAGLANHCAKNRHQIAISSTDGDFHFYAYEHPDGSHTFETTYVWEHGWLLTPQSESGRLSPQDWEALVSLRRFDKLPQFEESDLRDPGETWGVLQRDGDTIVLREAEWNELRSTQANASLHSMVFKAKASL